MSLQQVRMALLHYHLQDREVGYVFGHVPVRPAILDEFREDWHFLTILRDPVDRFISEYLYNRHKSSDHFAITDEMEDFLDSPDARRLGSQLVNFLSGRPDVTSAPTDGEVRNAIRCLDRFSVVGVIERMEDFRSELRFRFGRSPVIPRTNPNPAPEGARLFMEDTDVMARIRRLNRADREVYRHALTLLESTSTDV